MGSGSVEIAAYGMADAEHLVEKEIAGLWPGVHVRILEVRRPAGAAERIAEEFTVEYRVSGALAVEAPDMNTARTEGFRQARARFAISRYRRIQWEKAEVEGAGRSPGSGSPD